MSTTRAWREEESIKESVYTAFEELIRKAAKAASSASATYSAGKYDDDEKFVIAGQASHARHESAVIAKEIRSLHSRPYFAHVQLLSDDEGDVEDYLLSDSEDLERIIDINASGSICIMPFKQTNDRPLLDKLRLFYSFPSENKISFDRTAHGIVYHNTFTPQLSRNVEVSSRKLISVGTVFDINGIDESEYVTADSGSEAVEETGMTADEFLAKKLEENRSDAHLRNIISTLQRQQFEIIQTDIRVSFAVQGCAGSGKTQCMIHRLFFLRETLSDRGWDKVLLITPTQLFREYSLPLLRKYRLTDISNYSLAEFYTALLTAFDQRFRNRQYVIELTEEYLPDVYLQQVYTPEQITGIEEEIRNAIRAHVVEGFKLLEEDYNDSVKITIDLVNRLVLRLSDEIKLYDEREKELAEDPEYEKHRKAIDDLDKEQKTLLRRQNEIIENRKKMDLEKEQFDLLQQEIEAAQKDVDAWKQENASQIEILFDNLRRCTEALDAASNRCERVKLASHYARALFVLVDETESYGKKFRYNSEYLQLLEAIVEECREKQRSLIKSQTPAGWLRNYSDRVRNNDARMQDIEESITINQMYQDDHTRWLQAHNIDDARKQHRAHRAALERARYYLSRIESSVFETEVWSALAPLKEKCGIRTMQIEKLPDGHQKEIRILYKSDLLFYLKIYLSLHPANALPRYNLICIDEGQDLHSADYTMLREIYPQAVLNIFGDTAQALHESCGISDWKPETGVETVFEMMNNYRNTPAIVDFCNRSYDVNMKYVGAILENQKPQILSSSQQISRVLNDVRPTIIVRDRQMYEHLLELIGYTESMVVYIDTKADFVPEDKIACYSIFAAKGLEFTAAFVYAKGMNRNQKIVASTRAMERLYYFE